jgi:hypothetical protein
MYDGSVDAALAERLAADAAGSDGLPLVQHALMCLHAVRGTRPALALEAADYPADGLAGPALAPRRRGGRSRGQGG